MAGEVKSITSEALEAAYRALTPSQSGFTQDLQASNTIIPVLDLTADAQGTNTPEYLQTALAFQSQTAFDVVNTTTTLANSPGFWRIYGVGTVFMQASVVTTVNFALTDGLSNKIIWESSNTVISSTGWVQTPFDFVVFLAAGESLSAFSNQTYISLVGSYRQVADVNVTLINPGGFLPQ